MLSFKQLDVYKASVEFLALVATLCPDAPKGIAPLIDQLRRAATSIPLNIAEASGRTGMHDKAKHYAIARGSAMECGAALEALFILKAVDEKAHSAGDALLDRIVAMLTRMCLSQSVTSPQP